jgi:hypothetical protein
MKGKKPAKNFGGRPVEREPDPDKRAHMSLSVPLRLKRKVEEAAMEKGWSVSMEAAHRLEASFELPQIVDLLFGKLVRQWEASGRLAKPSKLGRIPEDEK